MRKYILTAVMIALLAVLCGCTGTQDVQGSEPSTVGEDSSQQMLKFSVTAAEIQDYTVLSPENLGGKTDAYITYWSVAEVNVHLGGADIPLEEAIRSGELTVPELFAFARMDAQNGFCKETYASERGLTHFSYSYPECVLELAYDVYETPDGNQTLINEVAVTDHNSNLSHKYLDENSEWGYFLDREDWGLTFEVSSVSPTQLTLDYTQQGGQQIGELFIDNYFLYHADASARPDEGPGFIGNFQKVSEELPIPILSDTSGQITIDWSADAGTLEPGDYFIQMDLSDVYEESEVPPLTVNYYDKQRYNIAFTVADAAEAETGG